MQVNPPEPHCLRYPPTTAAHHTQRVCKARGIENCKKVTVNHLKLQCRMILTQTAKNIQECELKTRE